MPVTFQVVGNLADFGNVPRAGVKVRATALPGIKSGDAAAHSNEPETVTTGEDGAFALTLISVPGVWYRIQTPYANAINTTTLAGYTPDVEDPTTGTAFAPGVVIDLIDVMSEDPTPGYEAIAYVGGGGGVTDHGALSGLGDDDHTQYALADGSRGSFASTAQGALADTAVQPADLTAYATDADLSSHAADTTAIHGIADTSALVLTGDSRLSDARTPTTHTHVATTDLTATGTKDSTTFLRGDNTWAVPAGGGGGVTDHGALTGLGDDDHTQYALANGTRGSFAAPLGSDDNYVTDAEKTKLSNLSGTNTGDQTLPTWSTISGKPAVVAAGATQADARTAIGAGTSSLVIGTGAGDAKAGNYQPTAANISDSTATGRAVLTATDAAAARTALSLGTAATTAATAYATAAQGATADTAVQPARQIIAGTGLTGGGTLAADRTLTVAYGTTSTTAAVGNDSRITGAVPNTRQVIAGTGLTGGGALSADRTLTVAYGTTSTTAAVGNDARLSDARTPTAHVHAGTDITSGTVAAARLPAASDTAPGIVELATTAEATTGTDTTRAVTAAGVKAVADTKANTSHSHAGADITSGTVAYARLPVGTTASTVAAGDDSRIVGALQASTAQAINAQTGTSYTLVSGDAGKVVTLSNTGAITLNAPGSTFTAGQRIDVVVINTGMATVVGTSGATANGTPSLVSRAQWSAFTILWTSSTACIVIGDLA